MTTSMAAPLSEVLLDSLAAALPDHLLRQRWFAGKGRAPAPVRITSIDELRPPWPGLVRVVIECDGATQIDHYQLLLGLRPDDAVDGGGDPATVCAVTVGGRRARCFDALADPEMAIALLDHVAPSFDVHHARPIGVEQSNTSIVYDDRLILKVYRRLAAPNPDVEVTVGLASVGFAEVAEPLAVWRSGGQDLALLQRFLAGATDGWALMLAAAVDVMNGHAVMERSSQDGSGGDRVDIAALGDVTARLHLALAAAFGTWPADPGAWADAALARMDAAAHPGFDRAAVAAAIERIRGIGDGGRAIRIHGDYHLGQVMRTASGWHVLDFEGEPARPVAERRTPASPLRDVAGMLRSFAYAAGAARRVGDRTPAAEAALRTWEDSMRAVFLDAYLAQVDGFGLLPADRSSVIELLDAFELDKAVYEVAYEEGHRPDWVDIPLAGVRALLERATS